MFHLRLHLRRYVGCSTELKLTLLSLLLWTGGRGMVRGFPLHQNIYICCLETKQGSSPFSTMWVIWKQLQHQVQTWSLFRKIHLYSQKQPSYLPHSPSNAVQTLHHAPNTSYPCKQNSREKRGHNNHRFIAMIHNLHWGDSARVFSQWGHRRLWFGDVLCLSGSWLCPPRRDFA